MDPDVDLSDVHPRKVAQPDADLLLQEAGDEQGASVSQPEVNLQVLSFFIYFCNICLITLHFND